MIDLAALKLVIWDLDETFWKGTLSEGPVSPIPGRLALLENLSEHGIMNSVCSKNDERLALEKMEELGVARWIVFPSIDWTSKGTRIGMIVKRMGLRAENCLFIDDNALNLAEAASSVPGLQVSSPAYLPEIQAWLDRVPGEDKALTRLSHYRVLEKRKRAEEAAVDNETFLATAGVKVSLDEDCVPYKERILELIHRTNQLNFTKWRCSEEELDALLEDTDARCGSVRVSDRFGDYGISGFYAVREGRLQHFLFSCRVLGLGVEQYVFASLGYPALTVQGPVASQVHDGPAPVWINQPENDLPRACGTGSDKVVFKGNCELKQMSWYLDTSAVKEEFAYVNDRGQNIEYAIHSVNYLSFPFYGQQEREFILRECLFADAGMFGSDMYSPDVALILLSTLPEANLGVYRHKKSGIKIAFGEGRFPLTDPQNWDGYIRGEIFTSGNAFTRDWLERFSAEWESLGPLTPEEVVSNARMLLQRIAPRAKVCYILGSEMPYLGNTQPNYEGRHLVHAEINRRLRLLADQESRIALIDVNDYLRDQKDFTDNINHFQRRVYYEMARKANAIIADCTGSPLKGKGRYYLWSRTLIDRLQQSGLCQLFKRR